MNKFNLKEELIESLYLNNFKEPLKVQEEVIPLLLNKENILVQAKTGSGKTLSYLIPILNMINFEDSYTSSIILTPTRELALQIYEVCKLLSASLKVNVVLIIGQHDYNKQINQLKHKPHIIIGTPGRIIELIKLKEIKLDNLKLTIIDEADEFNTLGLKEQLDLFISLLPKTQFALFSATISENYINFPLKKVIIDNYETVNPNISQYFIKTNDKYETLLQILNTANIKSSIVYFNTKQDCINTYKLVKELDILTGIIHGDMSQNRRTKIYNDFKEGSIRILFSSDVISRGMDFKDVSHIINYDIPNDIDTYIHRCGRSGRLDDIGISISLISNENTKVIDYILSNAEEYIFIINPINLNIKLEKEKIEPIITKIIIRAGKKNKLRLKDIVGSLSNYIDPSLIGVINLQDNYTEIEILSQNFNINILADYKIKGKKHKVEIKRK
ncbi:MAG: DEAD/DEAH box helicase [Erysipelotrichaceae bacterium]|nr:DEAD/DEAH box helicase [Erysipelotrichaceae bacterium]